MNLSKSKKQPLVLLLILVATVIAVVFLMVNTAQAALDKKTETYNAEVALTSLNVGLTEANAKTNGVSEPRANGETILEGMIPSGESLSFGKYYEEKLEAVNTGDQAEYVRIVIKKYWCNDNDAKRTDLSPDLIMLDLADKGWVIDQSASTEEQVVLYSIDPVKRGSSLAFLERVAISPDILAANEQTILPKEKFEIQSNTNYSVTSYAYDDCWFGLSVEVDSVQTHNATKAIKSAWGVDAADLGIKAVE